MTTLDQKNRRTGLLLALIAAGLFVYSFLVVSRRGKLPEPSHLTPFQRILRGL